MNAKIKAIVISFLLLNSSFLGAVKFERINWELYGAQDKCDSYIAFFVNCPEILNPYKQELLEILRRYNNGVAMNESLDGDLRTRLHTIQRKIQDASNKEKCDWYDEYMIEVRKSRLLGAQKAISIGLKDPFIWVFDDEEQLLVETDDESPSTKNIRELKSAIIRRFCAIREDVNTLPKRVRQFLYIEEEVESLLWELKY